MEVELFDRMKPFLGDLQKLQQRMAGQMDLWEECVKLLPNIDIFLETDRELQGGNYSALYTAVHRLKGSLANFGFEQAAEMASAVLSAIRENDCERIEECYIELKNEYTQIAEQIGGSK